MLGVVLGEHGDREKECEEQGMCTNKRTEGGERKDKKKDKRPEGCLNEERDIYMTWTRNLRDQDREKVTQ